MQTSAFNTLLNTSQHGRRKESIQLQKQSPTYTIRLTTSSIDQKQKETLTDARSYGGTEASSNHRLVVARMEIIWSRLYHQKIQRSHQQKFDTKHLTQSKDAQDGYNEQIMLKIRSNLHPETTYTNK